MDVEELLRSTGQAWQAPPVPPLDAERALARQAQRRHARVAVATAAAVVVAGAVGLASWPRAIPATPVIDTPTAGLPTGSPTTAPIGPGLSAEIDELTQRAQDAAQTNGYGTTMITAQAVLTSLDKAEQLLHLGHSEPVVDTSVWVIQLRGKFVCRSCSWPAGGSAPRGTVMHLVIPRKNLLTADHSSAGGVFGLVTTPVDLSRLGTVTELDLGESADPQLGGRLPPPPPSPPTTPASTGR